MQAIFKRETKSYYTSMVGYVAMSALVFVVSILYWYYNIANQMPDFSSVLYASRMVLLFILPALTMRAYADERHNKTDQLLMTSPVSVWGIVLGKFFSQLMVLIVPFAAYCAMALVLAAFGKALTLNALVTIGVFFLMSAACLAFGNWISTLTENQIIAYLATAGGLLVCYLLQALQASISITNTVALVVFCVLLAALSIAVGLRCRSLTVGCAVFCVGAVALVIIQKVRSTLLATALNKIISALMLFEPLQNFVSGVFDVTAIVYYLSVIVLFLFLTGQALEKRRWN